MERTSPTKKSYENQNQHSENNRISNQTSGKLVIPSNIMVKLAYPFYHNRSLSQPYMVETIQELYNYVYSKKIIELNEELEIEAKLGRLHFRGSYVYGYESIQEIFKIPNFDSRDAHFKYDFVSGLEQSQFYSIWYFVDKEADNPKNEIKKLNPKNYNEIHYKSGKRKSALTENNIFMKEDVIKKENKVHFNIRDNGNDFRITACKEIKHEISDDDIPTLKRDKFRVSYEFGFFRLDFTIVNSTNINDCNSEISYEIEFELITPRLMECYDYFRNFVNFQYIFNRFFQNIFCFYQLTNPEYFADRFPNDRDNKFFGNIYGNYLEKNFDKRKLDMNN